MPRIDLSEVFGEKVPEGIDLEKTGTALEEKVEAILEQERAGVRSSEQENQKKIADENELLKAQLEDLQKGGTPKPDPTSATEPGSKAEEIRKRQAEEQAAAAQKAMVEAAVNKTKRFFVESAEALKTGVPEAVVALAGEDPDKLQETVALYRAMNPEAAKAAGEKSKGKGNLTPNNDTEQVESQDPDKMTSFDRALRLVNNLPTVSMQGGQVQDLGS